MEFHLHKGTTLPCAPSKSARESWEILRSRFEVCLGGRGEGEVLLREWKYIHVVAVWNELKTWWEGGWNSSVVEESMADKFNSEHDHSMLKHFVFVLYS